MGRHHCVDCDEYLCKIWLTSHKRIRLTANHNILQGSKFSPVKLHGGPSQPVGEFCEFHKQELVTDICMTHRQIICGKCKTSKNRKCADLRKATDICGKQAVSRLQSELKVLLIELKVLEQKRTNDVETLSYEREATIKEIQDLRKQFNLLFDRLEENNEGSTTHC